MGKKSKYTMSRMSMRLKKMNFKEITPKGLRLQLKSSPSPVLWYNVMYLNDDKTKCLIYSKGNFFLLKQKPFVPKGDDTIYDKEDLSVDYVIHMLDMLIRKEKLQKIKKKINANTTE
jgi:hypothetical protein